MKAHCLTSVRSPMMQGPFTDTVGQMVALLAIQIVMLILVIGDLAINVLLTLGLL